ncbi:MAG TPA: hypothetical protein EYP22_08405 [Methanosarcinales archaeon]|nr:hypothetical protein [Methanosarcinales archaeon]
MDEEVERVKLEARRDIYDSLPKLVVYVSIAILIYLFAMLVFRPLGDGLYISYIQTSDIILGIGIIAILILLWRVIGEVRDICNALGGLIAANVGREGASEDEIAHYQKAVKGIIYVFAVVIAFLFIGSMLMEISGGFAGIVLIIIFLWAVWTLYSAGMALSTEIELTSKEFTQKLEERLAKKKEKESGTSGTTSNFGTDIE